MPKNLCPFDLERRPCMEHDCALYVQTHYQDYSGKEHHDWACVFVATFHVQCAAVIETQRVQASVDKTATEVALGSDRMAGALYRAATVATDDTRGRGLRGGAAMNALPATIVEQEHD